MKSPHAYRGIEEKAPTKNKNVNKLNIIYFSASTKPGSERIGTDRNGSERIGTD